MEVTAIARRAYWYRATNRIAATRFDFVLCDRADLQPVCVINLHDPDTDEEFMDRLCETVGLPQVRLPADAARSYSDVREAIESALQP